LLRVTPEVGLDVEHDGLFRGLPRPLEEELQVGVVGAHDRVAVDVGEVGLGLVATSRI
jgi:hypothetical protein